MSSDPRAETEDRRPASGAEGARIGDNPERHRYEARIGEEVRGFIDYRLRPGVITILHTEVDRAAEGQGLGSQLAAAALDDIRRRGLSAVVLCPFVRTYILRHPEYGDLVTRR